MNPPPLADETIAEALDELRFAEIGRLLALSAKYSAAGSLAADSHEAIETMVRARQAATTCREALCILNTIGQAEVCE